MRLRVVAVGTLARDKAARALADEYEKRIARWCAIEERELRADKELGAAFARACDGATTVALDPAGEALTSATFARQLERLASRGKGVVAFLIGGPDGLPREIVASADARWSLSALTLPHRLARVLLLEQLYRAMTILRGAPYDK